jgi:hypothetical protein
MDAVVPSLLTPRGFVRFTSFMVYIEVNTPSNVQIMIVQFITARVIAFLSAACIEMISLLYKP